MHYTPPFNSFYSIVNSFSILVTVSSLFSPSVFILLASLLNVQSFNFRGFGFLLCLKQVDNVAMKGLA